LSLFLIVSDEAREGLTTLLPLLGAVKHQVAWIWNEEAKALRESIRQVISDRKPWSIYEAGTPGNESLIRVSEMVAEQLQEQGEAVLDLVLLCQTSLAGSGAARPRFLTSSTSES